MDQAKEPLCSIQELPGPPDDHWLTGHWPTFSSRDVTRKYYKLAQKYGGIFGMRVYHKNLVIVADPDLVKHILKVRPQDYRRFSGIEVAFNSINMSGVFSAEGERWRYQRKLIAPSMRTSTLAAGYPLMVKVSERLEARCKELAKTGEAVDFKRLMNQFTIDSLCNVIFDHDTNGLQGEASSLLDDLKRVFPGLNRRMLMYFPLRVKVEQAFRKREKQFDAAAARIRTFLLQQVDRAKQQLAADPSLKEQPQNVIQALIIESESHPDRFTDDDVIANLFTIFLAGIDTTANAMVWMMYLLGINKPSMKAVQKELDHTDLNALKQWPMPDQPILVSCIHEAMRLKPPTPQQAHETINAVELGGYRIPAKTPVLVLQQPVGMDPKTFADPETFNPYRWLRDGGNKPSQIVPFGGGPRMCSGRAMALTEMQLAMSTLLGNFDIEVLEPEKVRDNFQFILEPSQLNVRIKERQRPVISKTKAAKKTELEPA